MNAFDKIKSRKASKRLLQAAPHIVAKKKKGIQSQSGTQITSAGDQSWFISLGSGMQYWLVYQLSSSSQPPLTVHHSTRMPQLVFWERLYITHIKDDMCIGIGFPCRILLPCDCFEPQRLTCRHFGLTSWEASRTELANQCC